MTETAIVLCFIGIGYLSSLLYNLIKPVQQVSMKNDIQNHTKQAEIDVRAYERVVLYVFSVFLIPVLGLLQWQLMINTATLNGMADYGFTFFLMSVLVGCMLLFMYVYSIIRVMYRMNMEEAMDETY